MNTTESEVLWKEREDGLVEYVGSTDKTAVAESWQKLDSAISEDIWAQASIAAAIIPKYGKGDLQELATEVDVSYEWIRKMSKTYRFYTQNTTRVVNSRVKFKHHVISLKAKDPRAAVLLAAEKGWSCAKLEEWILKEREGKDGLEDDGTEDVGKRSELLEFLEHVEDVIQDDFIDKCPNLQFAKRVFGAWLGDLRDENKEVYQSDVRDMVRSAIVNRGARNVPEIVKATGVKQGDVERAVSWLVEEMEEYEWIEQGGETDQARGSNAWILHKVGERSGDGYNAPRATNNYSH